MIANFWCEHCTCGAVGKDKDLKLEVDTELTKRELNSVCCPNAKKRLKLKHLGYTSSSVTHIVRSKHAKGRTPKEREKRRVEDFIKNTLETIPKWEQNHFKKKFKKKGFMK